MPPKGKTKNALSPHDKRHENSLAAPGKRVARQRSNGQLNGVSNGKLAPSVSPPALPSTGLNSGFKFPRAADDTAPGAANTSDNVVGSEEKDTPRTASDASMEEEGPHGERIDAIHEQVSVESQPTVADKHAPPHAGSTFSTVSTILTYYPLRDAISILILLLSLPPTLVLFIQTLFASLTFVPPTAGLSMSTLPNVKEMFNSSNFGYPALATILFVDVFFWGCWLTLWKPTQAIFLDLSQAVIAVSLSGAAASTGGPTYSIATCALIVCVSHVLRYQAIHLTAYDYLRSVLHKMDVKLPLDAPAFAPSYLSQPPIERGMLFNIVRTILGIHIVSQGVTTCVRRTLANAKANEKDHNLPAIIKTDTEAAAGADLSSRAGTGMAEGLQPPTNVSTSDGRLPGPPSHRDGKARESNSKKKKKQANQVRSQQPLWAAIASTKVTFVKEMEQRDAADDAREAAAMDNNTTNLFLSATNTPTNRVWICEVRDTEIYFAVELSPEAATETVEGKQNSMTPGIDKSKPFFIRVNGAVWSSARIMPSEDAGNGPIDRYVGEVFGLAPMSSYHCEIVSIASQRVLCSASLITQPAPTAEQAAAVPAPTQHQTLRPSSPITTLKQSIQSAEAKLNETRNRLKKTKKDQRAAHADVKKEINALRGKMGSSGGLDDKQERRLLQINQHKNQAEEATAELKTQIDAMGDLPSDDLAESQAKRRTWQSALDAKKAANADYESAKADQDRELAALRAEITASESKKEKLAARSAQRAQELERLAARQQSEMMARSKQGHDRAHDLARREHTADQFHQQIAAMEYECQSWTTKAQEAYQASAALSGWPTKIPPGFPGYSSPPTPEGMASSNQVNGQPSPQANGFPSIPSFTPGHSFTPSNPFIPSSHMLSTSAGAMAPRGRSSSMLSQISGFTDDDYHFGPDIPSHQQQQHWSMPQQSQAQAGASSHSTTALPTTDRQASDGDAEGSANGSGSAGASVMNGSTNGSNSPRPEAKPFIPGTNGSGNGKGGGVGTIGQARKTLPPSPVAAKVGANGR
ncbi:unnamed protein product [Zymoseptoria tritici ST99CH_1A5]|uniref:Ubiquitination network signaling protein n=1 Tax=Zymoseptoria tritici ST99CH_1A5 TaxID=1276529 RepID=A0A1Y6LXA7_ZYMTR|nr:unnamed protein product [Zymoseptoria tritici ST99CH_1A5]